jgi:hypothetical protein
MHSHARAGMSLYTAIHEFCKELSLCSRGHAVFHGDQWFNVYCFFERGDAEKFMQRFGGEWFDPRQRGKGSNWGAVADVKGTHAGLRVPHAGPGSIRSLGIQRSIRHD